MVLLLKALSSEEDVETPVGEERQGATTEGAPLGPVSPAGPPPPLHTPPHHGVPY